MHIYPTLRPPLSLQSLLLTLFGFVENEAHKRKFVFNLGKKFVTPRVLIACCEKSYCEARHGNIQGRSPDGVPIN